MITGYRNHRMALTITFLVISLTLTACGLGKDGFLGGGGKSGRTVRTTGVGAENLKNYAATFTVTFEPDSNPANGWVYSVDTVLTENPPARQQTLVIEGLGRDKDPGDTTLIQVGDKQYMIGEGVGSAGCLIFPASVDLSKSYLTPGDFLPASSLTKLDSLGNVEVAGQAGERFTFAADAVGDFTDVKGDLVRAKGGDYVLLYALTGHTLDTRFGEGTPGKIVWHYEITDLSPDEALSAPAECEISLPIMADAQELSRLPGLISYTSATAAADVVAFYQNELVANGWLVYEIPATSDKTTLLHYARAGELLKVSIDATATGARVQLFLEDRPAP